MSNPFVHRLESLSHLKSADIRMLEELCKNQRDVGSKRYIFRESSGASSFPVIISGWAARHHILRNGGRQITRLMLPGDAYYFDASPDSEPHDEVVTLSPCRFVQVSHAGIESAIRASAPIGNAMRNYGCLENSILSSMVVSIGRRDAIERMAYLVCELHSRLGSIEGAVQDDAFDFPLTQDDLADVLGLTPVHVNRKLQQLRKSGIISLRSKRMHILDLPELRQIAGFTSAYLAQGRAVADPLSVPT
jgi:CRP-like cAMP-binding protein